MECLYLFLAGGAIGGVYALYRRLARPLTAGERMYWMRRGLVWPVEDHNRKCKEGGS